MNNRDMKTKNVDALWSHVHWLGVLSAMGSFTAAARRLNVSKAAMSHRIGELEHAAGVALVQRTTRSVRLTEAGQQLVDSTRAPFAAIEQSFVAVKDRAIAPHGLLRVTAPVALGRQQVVPLLPPFLREYPEVRVELELSDHLSALSQEGFDLAIRHASAVPDTHVAWSLCQTRSYPVAVQTYLRNHGTPVTPADLAQHNCLYYPRSGFAPAWSFEPERGTGGRLTIAVSGSFAANNSEALRETALAGLGIALLPDFSAQQDIASGRLVRVLPKWRSVGAFGDQVFAIRPYSAQIPRTVSVFVAHLRNALAGGFTLDEAAAPRVLAGRLLESSEGNNARQPRHQDLPR